MPWRGSRSIARRPRPPKRRKRWNPFVKESTTVAPRTTIAGAAADSRNLGAGHRRSGTRPDSQVADESWLLPERAPGRHRPPGRENESLRAIEDMGPGARAEPASATRSDARTTRVIHAGGRGQRAGAGDRQHGCLPGTARPARAGPAGPGARPQRVFAGPAVSVRTRLGSGPTHRRSARGSRFGPAARAAVAVNGFTRNCRSADALALANRPPASQNVFHERDHPLVFCLLF